MSEYFRNPFEHRRFTCSSGCEEIPVFVDEGNDKLVDTGKKTNVYKKIQTFKDECLLENIIKRCVLTGETLVAPKESFGDTTVLPKSIVEVHEASQKVNSFVGSLSDSDLADLNEKGFDAFISAKIVAAAKAKAEADAAKEVKTDE